MHARSAFDLDEEGNPLPSKRHLVKLMLQDPELTWDLPESLSWYSKRVFGQTKTMGADQRSGSWASTHTRMAIFGRAREACPMAENVTTWHGELAAFG